MTILEIILIIFPKTVDFLETVISKQLLVICGLGIRLDPGNLDSIRNLMLFWRVIFLEQERGIASLAGTVPYYPALPAQSCLVLFWAWGRAQGWEPLQQQVFNTWRIHQAAAVSFFSARILQSLRAAQKNTH